MELVLEILCSPETAFRKIRETPKIFAAVLSLMSAWLSVWISLSLLMNSALSWKGFIGVFAAGGFVLLVSLALKSMWLHFFAEIFGGEGKVTSLLSCLGYSSVPFHFILPCTLISQAMLPILAWVIWPAAILWGSALGFKAYKENYHLSTARATMAALSPAMFFILLLSIASIAVGVLVSLQFISLLHKIHF